MATHSSILACRIPGMEEPAGLLSMGSHRVGHDWRDLATGAAESHRQRSLEDYSPKGRTELDTTEVTSHTHNIHFTFNSMYISIPISQVMPLPLYPSVTMFIFYICNPITVS